jgi:hypothetical protein
MQSSVSKPQLHNAKFHIIASYSHTQFSSAIVQRSNFPAFRDP